VAPYYGRFHPTFPRFQAAIQEAFGAMSTKHFQQPAPLTTQILHQFEYANSLSCKVLRRFSVRSSGGLGFLIINDHSWLTDLFGGTMPMQGMRLQDFVLGTSHPNISYANSK